MKDDKPRRAECPRCKHSFDTEITISSSLIICPECAMAFDPFGGGSVDPANTVLSPLAQAIGAHNHDPGATAQPEAVQPGAAAIKAVGSVVPGASSAPGVWERPELGPGTMIEFFEIVKELGRGAMGSVYLARDTRLGRDVAVKFLAAELADDHNSIERFNIEGRALARLRPHPHIVSIYYKGDHAGVPFFAMEYIDGPSVKEVLKRELRLSPKRAVAICVQAARALSFVWEEARIVHRDIKPSNMMFNRMENRIKVTDFGLTKTPSGPGNSALTKTGVILGTPDYLSPEQARCEKNLDFRCDIYALGATLYHLLTGEPPFHASSIAEIVAAHLNAPPPDACAKAPGIPQQLGKLIRSMMAKQADARPSSYKSIIDTLLSLPAA